MKGLNTIKSNRILERIACIALAFMLSFTMVPVMSGTAEAYAATNNYAPTISDIYARGTAGGIYFSVSVYDNDNTHAAVPVDAYIGGDYVGTYYPDGNSSNFFYDHVATNKTGTQSVKFHVHSIDSSGNDTHIFTQSDPVTVNVRSIDSITVSDIKTDNISCSNIHGSFPACINPSIRIGTEAGKYFSTTLVDITPRDYHTSFYIWGPEYLHGTVYAEFTISNGIKEKKIYTQFKNNSANMDSGVVKKSATCTQAGVKAYTCKTCGYVRTQSLAKKGHVWDGGRVTRPAKYFSTGVKTYTCQRCKATRTATIPKKNVAAVTPARVTITSAKPAKKKVTVKWKRIAKNTKGYQIALKNKNTGKVQNVKVKQSSKAVLSKTIKKLQSKKTYAIRIRAYNVIGSETIYGPWSKVKSGKVK